jgi:hypothetical protein
MAHACGLSHTSVRRIWRAFALTRRENRQVMQEILGYIAKHPDAGDTLQNIAKWWIPFERLLASWKGGGYHFNITLI